MMVDPQYCPQVWELFGEVLEEVFSDTVKYNAARVFLLTDEGEWVEYAQSFCADDEVPPLPEFEDEPPKDDGPKDEDDHKHIW